MTELARLRDKWEEAAMEEFAAEAAMVKAEVASNREKDILAVTQETWREKAVATRAARSAWYTAAMQRQS